MSALYLEVKEITKKKEHAYEKYKEQKINNIKLMKAVKVMKDKMNELNDSGLNHMLHDMQNKCIVLEKEKTDLQELLRQAHVDVDDHNILCAKDVMVTLVCFLTLLSRWAMYIRKSIA